MRLFLIPLLLCLGCGDDDGGSDPAPDAARSDAALGADADPTLPDAQSTSSCGLEGDQVQCDLETEICVNDDLDGTILSECRDLPVGCTGTCATCSELCGSASCEESSDENTITCVTISN